MDYLWSPWRFRYIAGPKPERECIFCEIARSDDDKRNLVLFRAQFTFVVLNRYPYTVGHLMIVPFTHVRSLEEMQETAAGEMMLLMRRAESVLGTVYHPEGLNMGLNLGASAGAGVAGHLHMHVVPRWDGDANFMTTVAETRVLPESLEFTYEKLKAACARW